MHRQALADLLAQGLGQGGRKLAADQDGVGIDAAQYGQKRQVEVVGDAAEPFVYHRPGAGIELTQSRHRRFAIAARVQAVEQVGRQDGVAQGLAQIGLAATQGVDARQAAEFSAAAVGAAHEAPVDDQAAAQRRAEEDVEERAQFQP